MRNKNCYLEEEGGGDREGDGSSVNTFLPIWGF